jgi:NADPH:quinone reductase-like Zn-dependent oxidoreductase
MRAIIVDPSGGPRLRLAEISETEPLPDEALIRVEAISLNQGEVRRAFDGAKAGWNPGWDFAGVVERAAAAGGGPKSGERVLGLVHEGAWRERVCVPAGSLAVVPERVSLETASTLPVAGLTALLALAEGGLLAGKRILVSGASGGVGHLAVQLARASGAFVVAAVRHAAQRALAEADGADLVLVSEVLEEAQTAGPFDLILESAGGPALAHVMGALASGGMCVTFGNSSRQPTSFDALGFFYPRGSARLVGFYLFAALEREPASEGLGRLLRCVERGILQPRIEAEAPWGEIGKVADRFMRREISGKAVLRVRQS